MEGKIYKLSFLQPVHFGNGRLSDAEYTCDAATLFSALFIEALAAGCSNELLQSAKQGECVLSDCFPYIGAELYLPKPMDISYAESENAAKKEADSRSRKAAKKLSYIPLNHFQEYMNGTFDFVEEWENFKLGHSALSTKVNLTGENGKASDPYHVGAYSFLPECGIYFIYQGNYDIEPLMKNLAFSGLGGKRTSGYGAFEYSVESAAQLNLQCSTKDKTHMLLSSAAPREEELTDELLRSTQYKLDKRGGFIQSTTYAQTQRKKRDLWVFRPGSVFTTTFDGAVFDVNNTQGSHAVYRYAKALWMEV
jgi:CRISPR-associated protein Csm4